MTWHVIEKTGQRHCVRRMPADAGVKTDAHHLRLLRALLPQQVECVLRQPEEFLPRSKTIWQ